VTKPSSPSRIVSPELRFRVVVRILTAPRGTKVDVARRLAKELGLGVRTVLEWQHQYQLFGCDGLVRRPRADKGIPRLYEVNELARVTEAASRIRDKGDLRREWRASQVSGSFETFRAWVRKLQASGFVKTAREEEREAVSA
jgi:hypothetical protein